MKLNLTKKQMRYIVAVFLVLIAGLFGIDLSDLKTVQKNVIPSPTPNPAVHEKTYEAKIVSVIDGDTVAIEGGQKVRYIGINTPEIYKDTTGKKTGEQCFAGESYNENRRLVEGKTVKLVRDTSDTDKYGRLLRYVYVGDIFVNDYLVKSGFAKTMMVKPDIMYYQTFKESQAAAKESLLGLWKACPTLTPSKPQE